MNTEQPIPPTVVLSTAQLDTNPERAKRCLESLRVVLGIDSPETRGWAPIVQQEARRAIDRALAALADCEASKKDAERYRWLRDSAGPELKFGREQYTRVCSVCQNDGTELDFAIDRAMQHNAVVNGA